MADKKLTTKEATQKATASAVALVSGGELNDKDLELLVALREWRASKAGQRPAYTIAHNEVLEAIARDRPNTEEEFLAIRGVGQAFLTKHMGAVLKLISKHSDKPASKAKPKRKKVAAK